uniref:Uncharacterized protein n=1 Tax=Florenciella sp. virus SA2 TaxID=3240092 RepID=A0AB39JEY1_9VIRU
MSSNRNSQPTPPGINHQFYRPLSTNVLEILILILPYILIGFFILLSIFNSNSKAFSYIIGLICTLYVVKLFSKIIGNSMNSSSEKCNIFGPDFTKSAIPFGPITYMYTIVYLLLPMIFFKQFNIAIIIFLSLMMVADCVFKYSLNCISPTNFISIMIITFLFSYIYTVFIVTYMKKNVYYGEYISNKVACAMPSKQKFKCTVTKNGEIL